MSVPDIALPDYAATIGAAPTNGKATIPLVPARH